MTENEISFIARGAIFKVFSTLGPGLLESVYVAALAFECRKAGINVKTEVPLPVIYEGERLELGFRLDLLLENKVIIEVKSIELLADVHHKQVLTYLKLSGHKLGLLVNFNCSDISKNIIRKVNNL
jgi:GxxExxY protein